MPGPPYSELDKHHFDRTQLASGRWEQYSIIDMTRDEMFYVEGSLLTAIIIVGLWMITPAATLARLQRSTCQAPPNAAKQEQKRHL